MGGPPGTGKSTVADELDAVVLRTDEVRQRVPAAAGPDRYEPANVLAVYREALSEAETLLGLGHHVVLDATWGSEQMRLDARGVAGRTSSELVELRCVAPAAVAARRIEDRGVEGASSSPVPSLRP